MKIKVLFLAGLLLVAAVGCASLKTFLSGATTRLESNSLVKAQALRAQGVMVLDSYDTTAEAWAVTPRGISGEVMSVVLPANGQEDDGIVAFGNGRPDIAPTDAELYPFNLANVTTLKKDVVSYRPGYVGGTTSQIILLFGYFDVAFDQGTTEKKVRFYYADRGKFKRGDKLLYNAGGATDNKFYWYDKTANVFTSESYSRPASPEINAYVSGFKDPVRPNMVFYMLGAQLRNNTDYDGVVRNTINITKSVIEDKNLSFTVDFDVNNAVIFKGVTTEAAYKALTEAQLLQKFDMKQNTEHGWGDSGLYCSITFEATPKF